MWKIKRIIFLKALAREELAERELAISRPKWQKAKGMADLYREQCERMEKIYAKQDEILCIKGGTDV
jgi:hypothetical protein